MTGWRPSTQSARLALGVAVLASTTAMASGQVDPPKVRHTPNSGSRQGIERVEHRRLEALPSRGPADAPVIIELFLAPTQSPPSREQKAVEALQARHPERIRLVYRLVKATGTARLHYAALEAHAQGKFDAFMETIRGKPNPLTTAQLIELARSIEIDQQRLAAVLSNPPQPYDQVLDDDLRRLRRKLRAAPPFVLMNGRPLRDGSTAAVDLDQQYRVALQQAAELLDRGADPRGLADAFDAAAAPNPLEIAAPIGIAGRPTDDASFKPRLAAPALDLSGWPSLGPDDAPIVVAVLCDPASNHCAAALRAARSAQDVFADSVRVVWAPFFEIQPSAPHRGTPTVRGERRSPGKRVQRSIDLIDQYAGGLIAASATMRCGEWVGSQLDDFGSASSQGWRWLEQMTSQASHADSEAEAAMPDRFADALGIDKQALTACRNRYIPLVRAWIAQARESGVRTSPSTVINGRIYPAIVESRSLQQLIESELSPGDCNGCLHLGAVVPLRR